jgi:hypothetical protein
MSLMWTIVLLSLLAVVVAAVGVAGLAGVARALRRPLHLGASSAEVGTSRWFPRRNPYSESIEAEPDSEIRDDGSPH